MKEKKKKAKQGIHEDVSTALAEDEELALHLLGVA